MDDGSHPILKNISADEIVKSRFSLPLFIPKSLPAPPTRYNLCVPFGVGGAVLLNLLYKTT